MENIEVAIRIRPINISEISSNDLEIWDSLSPETIGISSDKYNELLRYRKIIPGQKTAFNFNYCYNQSATNQMIYDRSIKRIALSSLQGINGTVFMYGQTGSGKTFTILGSKFHHLKHAHAQAATENIAKKPPIPPATNHDFFERNLLNNQNLRSLKTPNKMNSASNIANIQIDINSLMSESEKLEIESEKGIKREQVAPFCFESSEANPMKKQTHECLFNQDENVEGILGLALRDMFSEMDRQSDKKFYVRCSYLEIYTDVVYDLLKEQDKLTETLTIGEDLNKEFFVKGATDEIATSVEDLLFILKKGEANRHYAATIMNHSSSRSHTIFRLFLQCIPSQTQDIITESVLNFVDLAGSEKVSIHDHYFKKTREKSAGHYTSSPSSSNNNFKDRVNESKHINKSLFFLTQVISLKSQGKPDLHIPFRNSPLTKILRSSLGGNSRTAIILCANPCFSQYEQTLSTIRFGLNAKKIENNIRRNIITSNNDEVIKNLIREYENKIKDMEKEKTEDQSRSQNLLGMLEKLQEQKNMIEERLMLAKKAESFNQKFRAKEVLNSHKLRNHLGDYIHFANVGVLHVNSYAEEKKPELKFDSQGKFAMEGLRILQEKEKVWAGKLDASQRETQSLQEKYKSLISKFNALETKLTKKRKKIQELSKNSEIASQENRLLNQFFELFEGKSAEVLSRSSLEFLNNLERHLQALLDALKLEKHMRTIALSLQNLNNDRYQELLKIPKGSLGELLQICRDSREKGPEVNLKSEFLKEIGLKMVIIEDKPLQNSSIHSNFKDLLSQINIKEGSSQSLEKPLDSFQTYFEKEHNLTHRPSEIFSEVSTSKPLEEPFESRLQELQRNFNEIKEKIKEKSFHYQEDSPTRPLEKDRNRENLDKSFKTNSPLRANCPQNKENLLSRREFGKNSRKIETLKGSTGKKGNFIPPQFERHLEVLKSSNKN